MITEVVFTPDVRIGRAPARDADDEICALPELTDVSNACHANAMPASSAWSAAHASQKSLLFSDRLNPELAVANIDLATAGWRDIPAAGLAGDFWRVDKKWYIRDQGHVFEVYSDSGWLPDTLRVRDSHRPLAQGVRIRLQDGQWSVWNAGLLGGGPKRKLTPAQEAAQKRLKQKKNEWVQQTEEALAIREGYVLKGGDGKPLRNRAGETMADLRAFRQRKDVTRALANDCTKKDEEGNVMVGPDNRPVADVTAYKRLVKKESAIKAMFVVLKEDGTPFIDSNGKMVANIPEYERFLEKQTAINANFFKKDSEGKPILGPDGQRIADLKPYRRLIERHSAINVGCFKKGHDGKPILDANGEKVADLKAYYARRKHKLKSTS